MFKAYLSCGVPASVSSMLPVAVPLPLLPPLTSPQNDKLMPESWDMVDDSFDTAPVYGQLGVDNSGHGAVAAISEMAVGRHLGGADDGQAGGNDSERCLSPAAAGVVDWMAAVSL